MKRLACPAAVLMLSIVCGCNNGTNTAQNAQQPNQASTATVQPVVIDGVGTEPAQAVAVFLDSLRRGDEGAANGVLTNLAREQVQKSNFVIQPPGNPDGKYQIGRVGFPYPEKTVALVECQWTEPTAAGQQPEVLEIVCEVHQEAQGWRIAGMGIKFASTDETFVLDFENAASLEATIVGATAQVAQPPQTNQSAGVPQQQVQQLPQIPPPGGQAVAPPQLAFPPLNNAPALR